MKDGDPAPFASFNQEGSVTPARQTATVAKEGAPSKPKAQPSPFTGLPLLLVMIAVFYFVLIRPQQKQMKDHKKMLEALKKGDRVLTSGGLYGTVINLRGADVDLKIADNVKVLVARSSISKLADGSKPPGDSGK